MAIVDNTFDLTVPAIIAGVSTLSVLMFDQPLAVVMTAAGGAMWAVWRHGKMSFFNACFAIVVTTITACLTVALAIWFLQLFNISPPPVRGLAGLIAFLIIDKPWRDKVIGFFGTRLDGVGK